MVGVTHWNALQLACALLLGFPPAMADTLFVARSGNDQNPGTEANPFATLERARDEIRRIKSRGTLPQSGIAVEIAGGVYELTRPIEFTAQDSGTETARVAYRARPGETVRLVAGKVVANWEPVAAPAILKRLEPFAHGKVFQADLKALGVTDLQGINNAGVYQSDPGLELFFQDRPMTLARYPNSGYLSIDDVLTPEGPATSGQARTQDGKFVCADSRLARWVGEEEIWLHGFWFWDWADERIPLGTLDSSAHTISLKARPGRTYELRKGQWFYAENVLSELDSPGEWYLDRATSVLYFWPPAPLASNTTVLSIVRDPVQVLNAAHLSFEGLLIEAGRGSGIVIKDGADVRIVGCTVRNMGNWGVKVHGGHGHGVVSSDVYQTGQGGIHLEGGDRKTLTAGRHYADNNHVHHTARWDPVYQQGITAFGVGNRVTHNLIDHVPHVAIGFTGNDQIIEYNEIHHAVFQSNDAGAIYTSPPDETWSMRGHRIRFNYLHDIRGFRDKGCFGVYLDDCFSSADISCNLFANVATAILIGGGRDNRITNNIFLKCDRAFLIDARGLGWAKSVGEFATKELIELNYKQPPWSTRYPELLNLLEDEPLAPKGNVVARNVCWQGKWGETEPAAALHVVFKDNLLNTDPRFKDEATFELQADSPAFPLGFQAIPFNKIGRLPR